MKQPESVLFYNARIINEGADFTGYLLTDGGMIAAIGEGTPPEEMVADALRALDLEGRMLLPGVIDTHVHFRDPGMTHKADINSESRAAVAGGVTSFIDMPNTNPPTVSIEAWEAKMELAAERSVANYAFFIGATNTNLDELLAADYTRVPGVKLFLGSSTGNMLVDSESMISRLFASVDALIAVHAESEKIIAANRAAAAAEYEGQEVPLELHRMIRSREACVEAARQAIELARAHDARLHLLHVSTADEIDLIPDNHSEFKITAETCPHYLWFDSTDYSRLGARVKCNPAIKEPTDRDALLKAVADGRIDTVATDHAPHLPADKEGDAMHAASGMPGIQFSLPVMLELSRRGYFPESTVVERMCHAPARLFGIDRRGFLRPGYYADLTIVDMVQGDGVTISDADVVSRCGWTPYVGAQLHYRVAATYVNGGLVYDDGNIVLPSWAMPLRFNNNKQ